MSKPAKKLSALLGNVLKGIALPAQVYSTNDYTYPHASTRDALRGDWERIGGDFKTVIKRENGKTTSR